MSVLVATLLKVAERTWAPDAGALGDYPGCRTRATLGKVFLQAESSLRHLPPVPPFGGEPFP